MEWFGGGRYQTELFWFQVTEIQSELAELKEGFIHSQNLRAEVPNEEKGKNPA